MTLAENILHSLCKRNGFDDWDSLLTNYNEGFTSGSTMNKIIHTAINEGYETGKAMRNKGRTWIYIDGIAKDITDTVVIPPFNVDFDGNFLMEISVVDGFLKVTNAVDGYGQNCTHTFSNSKVLIFLSNDEDEIEQLRKERDFFQAQNAEQSNRLLEAMGKIIAQGWKKASKPPTDYGKYLVYRAGCNKIHFETWNNTGWAYNNNDITHWMPIPEPPHTARKHKSPIIQELLDEMRDEEKNSNDSR